ncbi:MAG: polymorphic toxin-type HINT domain-containing protein [Nocardioides sp.]
MVAGGDLSSLQRWRVAANTESTLARTCLRSFASATLVLMADGSKKPIDQIEVGDKVIATDPETGQRVTRKVTHVWVHDDTLTDLKLADGTTLTTTEDHLFWSVTDQTFERADQLAPGEVVLGDNGHEVTVVGFEIGTSRTALAYNLSIAGVHTYHVGPDAIVVHNDCIPGGGASLDNIASSDAARIQQFADRTGRSISVVGSRAGGTAHELSDWDFLVEGGWTNALRKKGTWLLPRGGEVGRDFLDGPLNPELPFLTFRPGG